MTLPDASSGLAIPSSSPPKRRWRPWKWMKRIAASFLLLILFVALLYLIFRQISYEDGEKDLAEVRAELDLKDPGWRYDDLNKAYSALIPPPERNSATLIVQIPEPHSKANIGHIFIFLTHPPTTSELLPRGLRKYADEEAAVLPADNPILLKLASMREGGLPMTDSLMYPHEGWSRLEEIRKSLGVIEVAGAAVSSRQDFKSSLVYINAMLNAGRSIGDLPRILGQMWRNGTVRRAAWMTTQMLAWGEPDEGLEQLQREFLKEADRSWLKTTLRGERAVADRVVENFTEKDERDYLFFPALMSDETRQPLDWEDHLALYLFRPHRAESLASVLRGLTKAIEISDLPTPDRQITWKELEKRNYGNPLAKIQDKWRYSLMSSCLPSYGKVDEARAHSRTLATAIACERFRKAKGRWPVALTEIPTEILPTIPIDPYDGKPLRYRVLPDGVIVYSLGPPPLLNENALIDLTTYKIGTPLWNVSLRRKQPSHDFD